MKRRLLLVAVWLLGLTVLWWAVQPRPHHRFEADGVLTVADNGVVVTHTAPPSIGWQLWSKKRRYQSSKLAANGTGPVEAWDVRTGRRLWTAHGPEVGIAVEPTADGRRVMVRVVRDGTVTVELREAASGEVVGRFPAFSWFSPPDARLTLVADHDPVIHHDTTFDLLDTTTGGWRRRLPGGPFPYFSQDGRRLLVTHRHPEFGGRVYDTDSGRLVSRFALPRDPSAVFDNGHVADMDGSVWDADRHALIRRVLHTTAARQGSEGGRVSPDGRWSVEAINDYLGERRTAAVWRLADGTVRQHDPPSGWQVGECGPAAEGRLLAVGFRRERPPHTVGRWLSNRHPMFRDLGLDRYDLRTRLLDPTTEATVADLDDRTTVARLSADGRTLTTTERVAENRTSVATRAVPVRVSVGRFVALAVGWMLFLFALTRWRRRVRPPASH